MNGEARTREAAESLGVELATQRERELAKLRTNGHPYHSQSISQLESPKVIPIVDAIDLQTPSQALRFYCIFVDLINL